MNNRATNNALVFVALGLAIVAILVCVTGLYEGRPSEASTAQSGLRDRLRNKSPIRVGYANNEPQSFRDGGQSTPQGFYIDLVNEVASRAQVKVEWEEVTFANTQIALEGRLDAVVGAGFVSPERAKDLWFSQTVIQVGLGYLSKTGDERFRDLSSLNRPGLRIACALGSASEEYIDAHLPNAVKVSLPKGELMQVGLEVLSGRADAGIVNQAQCFKITQQHGELHNPVADKPFSVFNSGITIKYGDIESQAFWNTAIDVLEADGFLDDLNARYNSGDRFWTLYSSKVRHD